MVTIIIGVSRVIDYKMGGVSVDIPPFPEWNSGHYIEIPGEGIVFTGEKNDDGSRCYSGVIESHYSTDDWSFILSEYKNWLNDKEKNFLICLSYAMVNLFTMRSTNQNFFDYDKDKGNRYVPTYCP